MKFYTIEFKFNEFWQNESKLMMKQKFKLSKSLLMLCLLFAFSWQNCSQIIPVPIGEFYNSKSILNEKENFRPLYAGKNARHATCTGAVWYHENYLAILNLLGNTICVYEFDWDSNDFKLIQLIENQQHSNIIDPENLTVSSDGSMLAVCSAGNSPGIYLYTINLNTHLIDPEPILFVPTLRLAHNVRFVDNDNFLACATFDKENSLLIYKAVKNAKGLSLKLIHKTASPFKDAKAKGIAFTKDGRFAIACFAVSATVSKIEKKVFCTVAVYKFDKNRGRLRGPVSKKRFSGMAEDIALFGDDSSVIISNQKDSMLKVIPFDNKSGKLGDGFIDIKNPDARLSFPHGMSVSHDEKFIIVTNYGADKFNLYAIE